MSETPELPYDVVVPVTGDSAEAKTLAAAFVAARELQWDVQKTGVAVPTAFVYENGRHVRTLTKAGRP
jgi:hypothetical protein